jgi:hypothetical protein
MMVKTLTDHRKKKAPPVEWVAEWDAKMIQETISGHTKSWVEVVKRGK